MLNCTNAPKLSTVVTLVFNIAKVKDISYEKIIQVFRDIHLLHPGTPILVATTSKHVQHFTSNFKSASIKFLEFSER